MIDPYHVYMGGRKATTRQSNDAKSNKNTASKQQSDSAAPSTSKNSSVDSKSHHSSYMGGDSLSPSSTISTDHVTKASLAGSSSSSTTNTAASLPHKLPEFEYFRQSSPLMPEFYPRTSEFFSQGRRRSSIAVSPEATSATSPGSSGLVAAPAIPETSTFPSRSVGPGSGAKKQDSFNLPLTFEESESLAGEQLPVRLGLAPPSHSHGLPPSEMTYKARVGHGYYFFTPPPTPVSRTSTTPAPLRRRNTDMSETLSLNTKTNLPSFNTPHTTSPSSISPGAIPSSPQRASANSSLTSLPNSTLVGHASSSKHALPSSPGPRLPPTSTDCWDPEAYFTRSRSRVRGKMREFVYHGFPTSVVPYWHGYTSETIEAEMEVHLTVNAVLHGNTLRDFPEGSRPCRVLDIGCGRGVWCLDMAREWKNTEFVGLDIVPIQPPMAQMGDPDLEHRVSWVVANFLDPLPFPDASFDYVHIRFVLQGVPEDKWVDLFSEVRRILAPGGVLELMEGNHSFFGHASWVDPQELKDLEQGRLAAKRGVGVKMPKRLKVLNDASDSADIDAIEVVLERMMHRRFINPTPLSVVPSALLLPGFSNVANGNPRHIPVYAESTAQRASARAAAAAAAGGEAGSSSANATSSEDEGKRQGKFTSRGQIGKPLNSSFTMTDPDLFSAFTILQNLDHFSSSRELIWAEAEEEKRSLQGQPQPELTKMDSTRRFGQGNPAALKPFAHPWKSKDEFYRAVDAWIEATRASADTEHLLRKYLGWEQAHEDLTVEGRKYAERRRKMSTSSAAIPALGLDQLTLEDAAEKEEPVDVPSKQDSLAVAAKAAGEARNAAVSPTDRSAFAVSTTHAHEAPARLQTTRASAPDTRAVAPTEDTSKTTSTDGTKKKKKSKRPSSSGTVGSSSPTSFGAGAAGNGGYGRARTFGRGGAGNAASIPLPDAPAFMAGYAFASPATEPAVMFRGPATKASIIASSRGGSGARKASSSKSFSDRSSNSTGGKNERALSISTTATATSTGTAVEGGQGKLAPAPRATAGEISPAAAYAATQRVSHGLEEEHRLGPGGVGEGRRESRPVSPTSAVPSPITATAPAPAPSPTAASLGIRPAPSAAAIAADPRSVSMPVTLASAGTASVRIAEPLTRPSKTRSRSKSNAKAVAMIGFYDCTGFIAIA